MSKAEWNGQNLLSIGENIIYRCVLEDEEDDESKINVYLTNYRIIWSSDEEVGCHLLKSISEYGMVVGYKENYAVGDMGTGEYGLYFEDKKIWFYSSEVWKEFYAELSRVLIEEQ